MMVAKYATKYGTDCDEHLSHLLFVCRMKPHESTGEYPFFLLYGRDASSPVSQYSPPSEPCIKLILMITNLNLCSVLLKPGRLLPIISKVSAQAEELR